MIVCASKSLCLQRAASYIRVDALSVMLCLALAKR